MYFENVNWTLNLSNEHWTLKLWIWGKLWIICILQKTIEITNTFCVYSIHSRVAHVYKTWEGKSTAQDARQLTLGCERSHLYIPNNWQHPHFTNRFCVNKQCSSDSNIFYLPQANQLCNIKHHRIPFVIDTFRSLARSLQGIFQFCHLSILTTINNENIIY